MKKLLLMLLLSLCLSACDKPSPMDSEKGSESTAAPSSPAPSASLAAILAAQPAETQARYVYRHPQETINFIGLTPGMTVVEALPGRGWYSKILLDYLGPDGYLIGADYPFAMYPKFGIFDDEFIEKKKTWSDDWPKEAQQWRGQNSAAVSAFVFGSMPEKLAGTADAVLFIRALHNLSRFENDGGFLSVALADTYKVLKPGGIVGVVQHEARVDMSDEFADGSHGYLKKDELIAAFNAAGFELTGSSEINANSADRPTEQDVVWRLPPTFATSREDPVLQAKMEAIGESNRMTLKFRKR